MVSTFAVHRQDREGRPRIDTFPEVDGTTVPWTAGSFLLKWRAPGRTEDVPVILEPLAYTEQNPVASQKRPGIPGPYAPRASVPPDFGPAELEEARWLIRRALREDAPARDLTTNALFPSGRREGGRAVVEAAFVPRKPGVLCGLPVVRELFAGQAPGAALSPLQGDGSALRPGAAFLRVEGPARDILRLERIALNFLQRLCGIATHTRRWVAALSGTPVRLLDTRKTTPGWRHLEKYAVRAGGAENHRRSLAGAILLKDNHEGILRALGRGSMADWVRALRKAAPGKFLEVEVSSRREFLEAVQTGVDAVLLDNFRTADLRWAVKERDRRGLRVLLEASGGIRLQSVRRVAATGVDRISVGALTHSSVALDISLDWTGAYEMGSS
jgi:nicotinate-nucleotide pyrophosphorylase (carboxylating)